LPYTVGNCCISKMTIWITAPLPARNHLTRHPFLQIVILEMSKCIDKIRKTNNVYCYPRTTAGRQDVPLSLRPSDCSVYFADFMMNYYSPFQIGARLTKLENSVTAQCDGTEERKWKVSTLMG